jgi:NAD(P)-dependent dehydrogenase (short-subunit alcohol dehydrogenase family)
MKSTGTVIVTGGSRGIGAQTVKLCAQTGLDVLFTYTARPDRAQEVVDTCQALGVKGKALQADARDPATCLAVLDAAASMSPVVGLVNNAGITSTIGSFLDVDTESMRAVMDVNVMGTMYMCQAVVRHWVQTKSAGAIVNVSSIAATLGAPGEYIHYAGSKAAVEGFTIGLAKEFADRGIRANVVSPGTSRTEIHTLSGEPGRADRVAPKIPMKRAGDAAEIAEAIVWLLSRRASYVTGAVLRVAGGL